MKPKPNYIEYELSLIHIFDILAFIPERLWDAQLAYLALRSYIYDPYYTCLLYTSRCV